MQKLSKIIYLVFALLVIGAAAFLIFFEKDKSKVLNEPEKVTLDFYRYYLKDIYNTNDSVESPSAKLNSNGIYQLDTSEHVKFLNESVYFSSTFYENEIPVFEKCNEDLKTVTVEEVTDAGTFPEEFADACDFVFYHQWVGGQGEELNTVDIVKSEVAQEFAKVTVVVGNRESGPYSYPIVTLKKEIGGWKISDIELSFEITN